VPGVLRREPFTDEDMAQVSTAGGALDLDAMTIRVRYAIDGALDLLIERRPAAAGVELRIRDVEGRLTASADVRALDEEVVVLTGERALGALVHDHARLRRGELVQRLHLMPS